MQKKMFNFLLVCCVFAIATMVIMVKSSAANILITPTRVVFEGRNRYADVTLVNNGKETMRYEMEWVYHKMQPDTGYYAVVEDLGDEFDLSKHVVFSPRRVELVPGAKQKIRLALRRPAEIPDGDYHVHLKFKSLPVDDGLEKDPVVGAQVKINVSYTIPVILRAGEPDVSALIGRIELVRNQNTGLLDVKVPVKRPENSPYAVLGYIWVYHVDGSGNEELVGELSNAHIFPEIDGRVFDVPLNKDISGGSLKFVLRYFDKKNEFIYDEKVFALE